MRSHGTQWHNSARARIIILVQDVNPGVCCVRRTMLNELRGAGADDRKFVTRGAIQRQQQQTFPRTHTSRMRCSRAVL